MSNQSRARGGGGAAAAAVYDWGPKSPCCSSRSVKSQGGMAGGQGWGGGRGSPFVPGGEGKPPNALSLPRGGMGGPVLARGGGAAEKLPTRGANKMPIQSAELYTNSPGRLPFSSASSAPTTKQQTARGRVKTLGF